MDFPEYIYEIQEMVPDGYSEALDSMTGPYEIPRIYNSLGRERFIGTFLGENDHLTDMENIYLEEEKLRDTELEQLASSGKEVNLEKPELNESEIVPPGIARRYPSVGKRLGVQFSRVLPIAVGGGIVSDFLISEPPEIPPNFYEWLPGIIPGYMAGGLYALYHFKKKELKIREENTAQVSEHILGTLWDNRVYIADENARAALKSNQHIYPLNDVFEELETTLEEKYHFMDRGLLYVDTADSDSEIRYGREV